MQKHFQNSFLVTLTVISCKKCAHFVTYVSLLQRIITEQFLDSTRNPMSFAWGLIKVSIYFESETYSEFVKLWLYLIGRRMLSDSIFLICLSSSLFTRTVYNVLRRTNRQTKADRPLHKYCILNHGECL